MDKIATTFHVKHLECDDFSLSTKSGRSIRFKVFDRPNELFRYSATRSNIGVYVYSNSLGELRLMVQDSILNNWKNAFKSGPASDHWKRIGRNLCKVFQET